MNNSPFDQPLVVIHAARDFITRARALDIETIGHLAMHLPRTYENRTRIMPLDSPAVGQTVCVRGDITALTPRYGRKRYWDIVLSDGRGTLTVRLFHMPDYVRQELTIGRTLECVGEITVQAKRLLMLHPSWTICQNTTTAKTFTPRYKLVKGISQKRMRAMIIKAIHWLKQQSITDSQQLTEQYALSFIDALAFIHTPPATTDMETLANGDTIAHKRLAAEEIIAYLVSLRLLKMLRVTKQAIECTSDNPYKEPILKALGFSLTAGQQCALQEITTDLTQSVPMQRLLQGDVGCGKTIVAALAMLHMAAHGAQAILLAPTALLAKQHWITFTRWCDPLGIRVDLLVGGAKTKEKNDILRRIASGTTQIIIGTHALFQSAVQFHRPGLVVIDEQHRFGVEQRLALINKASSSTSKLAPHQLIISATPIPRTLAMTLYGNLKLSILDELPPNRKPIVTTVCRCTLWQTKVVFRLTTAQW